MDSNTKLVEDIYAAFGRGDAGFIVSKIADDCDWMGSLATEIPYSGPYRGPEGVMKFFEGIGRTIDVSAFEPKHFIASGDEVWVTGSWSGKVKATGKPFTTRWAMRWVIKNGKVTSYEGFEDSALTAAAFRG